MTQQLGTMDVFFEYVGKRKAGGTREATISEVQALAQRLTKGERVQLTRLIQMWEARDGKRYTKEMHTVKSSAKSQPAPQIPGSANGAADSRPVFVRLIQPPPAIHRSGCHAPTVGV